MHISMNCPSCNKTLSAPDTAAGKKAKCPACGADHGRARGRTRCRGVCSAGAAACHALRPAILGRICGEPA